MQDSFMFFTLSISYAIIVFSYKTEHTTQILKSYKVSSEYNCQIPPTVTKTYLIQKSFKSYKSLHQQTLLRKMKNNFYSCKGKFQMKKADLAGCLKRNVVFFQAFKFKRKNKNMFKTGTPPTERKVFTTTYSGLTYRTSAQKIHGEQTSKR